MPNLIDLVGQRFGELRVVSRARHTDKRGSVYWNCICDCGKPVIVVAASLRKGKTKSCGCTLGARIKATKRLRRRIIVKLYLADRA